MQKIKLPKPLKFDSSGSTSVRFFGLLNTCCIHWCDAKLPVTKLICPGCASDECLLCKTESIYSSSKSEKLAGICWDIKWKQWAILIAPVEVFTLLSNAYKAIGVTDTQMECGLGPDFLLQRIGYVMEVQPLNETVGKLRGNGTTAPNIDETIKAFEKLSVWRKFNNFVSVKQKYPKKPIP